MYYYMVCLLDQRFYRSISIMFNDSGFCLQIFRMEHERDIKRNEWDESKGISSYITKCVQICWLFAIQNPPMKLNWPKEETTLDDHLVEYTKRGTHIKFVVWPTLYLHDKGPLMAKGVVQPL